jgi:hypothetical protein
MIRINKKRLYVSVFGPSIFVIASILSDLFYFSFEKILLNIAVYFLFFLASSLFLYVCITLIERSIKN